MSKLHPDLETELQAVDSILATIEHLAESTTGTAARMRVFLEQARRAAHPAVTAEIAKRQAEADKAREQG
jgi:hypothetical protein